MLGGNDATLGVANAFPAPVPGAIVVAHLFPLAWTPLGVTVGDTKQDVGIALTGLFDWIDRTFPAEDEHAFVVPMRDIDLLARIGWNAPLPERIDETNVINVEDLPEEIVDGLARTPLPLVQCAACRRLCVRDDFVWKEKPLCAWDYHGQVFGRRGPWREGAYEDRQFATSPSCAYVAPPLLDELGVEIVLSTGALAEDGAYDVINASLAREVDRAHIVVRTRGGFTVLREA